jgi:hypothetical protein
LKEGRFDDVLEAIHSIWAPSQAHSIVVDFLPPHTEEVASNRRFFYGKALQSEREDHSGAYLYFPLPDGVFSDRLGYGSCSPNKLSSDILVHLCIKMKKVLPMSMAALEAAHDTLVTLNAPSGTFGWCLKTRIILTSDPLQISGLTILNLCPI